MHVARRGARVWREFRAHCAKCGVAAAKETRTLRGMACGTDKEAPPGFSTLREGQGIILQHGNDVFYNKAQASGQTLLVLDVSEPLS
jgi:hypothetical protein